MKDPPVAAHSATIAAVAILSLSLDAGAADIRPTLPGVPDIPIPDIDDTDPKDVEQTAIFGGFFTTNAGKGDPHGLVPGQNVLAADCAAGMEDQPKIATSKLNKSLGDWSCNGFGGFPGQLLTYLEVSTQYGNTGKDTEKIVLMYDGMDQAQWTDVVGKLVARPDLKTPPAFKQTLHQFTDRVHQVTPGAQVTLASYPEYATNGQLCLVNAPNRVFPTPAPGASETRGAFRGSIHSAFQHMGANFISVYETTLDHGTCNPNPDERFVTDFTDLVVGPITNHPTVVGGKAMGNIIADQLY